MAAREILMLTVDDERGASTRYRVLAHRPALRDAGFTPRVRFPLQRPGARRLWRILDLCRDTLAGGAEGLLFIHRKTYPPPFSSFLRRPGRSVIFDLDDAVDLPPPGQHVGGETLRRYRRNFEATVSVADLVLCGNRELADRLPHDRYALLPTPIDTERFRPDAIRSARGPVLGWVGHSDNLGYLESLAGPFRELARRHPELRIVAVADRPPDLPGLPLEFRRWTLERELSCFDDIAVGLMPLDDGPWARAKCSFKAIQYMSLGIPTVASPVGMNSEVITHGENGLLAAEPREWVEALDVLLSDPPLRQRIGEAGRRAVERSYSLRVVSRRLVDLLGAVGRGELSA